MKPLTHKLLMEIVNTRVDAKQLLEIRKQWLKQYSAATNWVHISIKPEVESKLFQDALYRAIMRDLGKSPEKNEP